MSRRPSACWASAGRVSRGVVVVADSSTIVSVPPCQPLILGPAARRRGICRPPDVNNDVDDGRRWPTFVLKYRCRGHHHGGDCGHRRQDCLNYRADVPLAACPRVFRSFHGLCYRHAVHQHRLLAAVRPFPQVRRDLSAESSARAERSQPAPAPGPSLGGEGHELRHVHTGCAWCGITLNHPAAPAIICWIAARPISLQASRTPGRRSSRPRSACHRRSHRGWYHTDRQSAQRCVRSLDSPRHLPRLLLTAAEPRGGQDRTRLTRPAMTSETSSGLSRFRWCPPCSAVACVLFVDSAASSPWRVTQS
jgi:hypothetical protein